MKKLLLLLLLIVPHETLAQDRVSLDSFETGLITSISANQLPYGRGTGNPCSSCNDVLFDEKPGSIVSRGAANAGYSLVLSTDASEIFGYQKQNGQLYLIKHYQGKLAYSLSRGSAFTEFFTGLNYELYKTRCIIYDDKAIIFNGIDDVGIFEGRGFIQYSFIPKGKVGITGKSRAWMANIWGEPSHLYYTYVGADPTIKESWPVYVAEFPPGYEIIGGGDGDIITGLAMFRDQLIIFKRYSMWALIGFYPESWRLIKVSSNYGARNQECISNDKGLLKFMSHEGLKAYNGSSIVDIDAQIEDKVLTSNNISGEYNYITISRTPDFDSGSSTRVITSNAELKLEEFSETWDESDLDGTLSNITYSNGILRLSTTTETLAGTTYERISDLGDWSVDEAFSREYNIDDDDTATSAENNSIGYTSSDYVISIGIPGGIKLNEISFKGDINSLMNYEVLGAFTSGNWERIELESLIANSVSNTIKIKMEVVYLNGDTDDYGEVILFTHLSQSVLGVIYKHEKWFEGQTAKHKVFASWKGQDEIKSKYVEGSFSGISLDNDVWGINLTVSKIGSTNFTFSPNLYIDYFIDTSFQAQFNLAKIWDITIKYTDSNQQFETYGTFELDYKNFDEDYVVEFGSMTLGISQIDYDVLGTSATFYTASCISTNSWNAWVECNIDTNTYTGIILSSAGRNLKIKGAFATTSSSYTPRLSSIKVDAIHSSGTYTTDKYVIDQADGGWFNFVADDNSNDISQTYTYSVRLATGINAIDNVSYSTKTTGDLLGGTTNDTVIQFQVFLESDDGTQNPTVYSFTAVYAPENPPVDCVSISAKDRWHVAISTKGDTDNSTWLVHDKNNAWTLFIINVHSFTKLGKDTLFANSSGIYKMYDGTTDAGDVITSEWKRVFPFDYSYDSHLSNIYTIGQKQSDGALDVTYTLENSTIEYTASNIDLGTSGRYRHRQPNPFLKSPVADYTIKWGSTSPWETNAIELFPEIVPEHGPQ